MNVILNIIVNMIVNVMETSRDCYSEAIAITIAAGRAVESIWSGSVGHVGRQRE